MTRTENSKELACSGGRLSKAMDILPTITSIDWGFYLKIFAERTSIILCWTIVVHADQGLTFRKSYTWYWDTS